MTVKCPWCGEQSTLGLIFEEGPNDQLCTECDRAFSFNATITITDIEKVIDDGVE